MNLVIDTYLDRVMSYANRRGVESTLIREELRDHLLEKIDRIRARGLPIEDAVFTAIEENGKARVVGYSLRPTFPLIDIRVSGTARGIIAIGPRAVGVFALGGFAMGVFTIGIISCGLISLGAVAMALLFAWAGVAVAPVGMAIGAVAMGAVGVGIFAVGGVAVGHGALGLWAWGERFVSMYDASTVPQILRWIGHYLPSLDQQVSLSAILLGIFLPSMGLGHWAIGREQRRLEKIDPDLRG